MVTTSRPETYSLEPHFSWLQLACFCILPFCFLCLLHAFLLPIMLLYISCPVPAVFVSCRDVIQCVLLDTCYYLLCAIHSLCSCVFSPFFFRFDSIVFFFVANMFLSMFSIMVLH